MSEQEIIHDLVSSWVSLGLEYVAAAPNVSALYIYVSSELGSVYPEIFFEQNGRVLYPSDVEGTDTTIARIRSVHRFQFEDLQAAERQFDAAGVSRPTEYRVYYEPSTRKLDVQVSRDLIYANDDSKVPERGIEYWLGDRAPMLT
ncbi:hypothetical protein AB1K54_06960 [Microbacterium sp. BWT-B31]|uniref:hypothetical protein n=1 Tax=Microbacterium sp. BWT-B31 TaxID=3232072 RepID=UPI00352709E4